jgi:hypothetical protein
VKKNCIKAAEFLFGIFLLLCSVPLRAQTFYGSIVGTVKDASGGVIPGAPVTLTNIGTSERKTIATDAAGNYRLMNLVPASYRIEVEMAGFKRYLREPIVVEVQSAVRIDAVLQVGNISETVEVTSQTPLLQTESATLGQVVESAKILDIPLVGRDVNSLVLLVPGVVPQGWGGGGSQQIGGGIVGQNAQWLDGMPLNTGYSNNASIPLSQDAVQEFRVTTSNTSADFGRFSGGVVNATSRSGTNEFHGSAYEFLRNRVFNAQNFFSNRAGLKRPPLTRNQFGATLGGPVIKEKVFFFFSYEGVQQRAGVNYLLNVPLDEWKTGDFSDLRDSKGNLIKIYDPLTTCGKYNNPACATDAKGNPIYTRQQFPDNKIPANRLDKTAQAILPHLWASPNLPGNPYTHTQNFINNASSGIRTNQWNWRIDYNASDKHRIFGRWTLLPNNPINQDRYGTGLITESWPTMSQQGVLGDTYTINPSTVVDLRLGFVRNVSDRYPDILGNDLTKWAWPASLNSLIANRTMPMPALSDFESGNFFGSNDPMQVITNRSNVFSVVGNVSKMLSGHALKFGGEARWIQFNFVQSNNTSGNFTFNNGMTAVNPLAPAGTGYSFASFMLGYGARGSLVNTGHTAAQEIYQGYYVTDDWRVTPKLTLTAGLRWELPGAWTERFDNYAVFDRTAASPLAQQLGMPNLKGKLVLVNSPERKARHNYDVPYNFLSPRIGLAYRLVDKAVLRAGYGLAYLPVDANFTISPNWNAINNADNTWVPSLDGGITPYATLNNPFPEGLIPAMGRDPSFQSLLLGQSLRSVFPDNPYAYNQQWNLNLELELKEGLLLEVAYAGAKGTHLSPMSVAYNQLDPQYMSLGTKLNEVVANPFYGIVKYGVLAAKTTTLGQLLRPYPQYDGVNMQAPGQRDSSYNSMQVKLEKRFRGAGSLLGAYTWTKLIGNTETSTSWGETNYGSSAYISQNYYDTSAERSEMQGNAPHRLVVSYVLDLPVGKGKKLLGGASGVVGHLVSGWALSGITSFQSGFPSALSTPLNLTGAFNASDMLGVPSRPNRVVQGSAAIDACAQCKLSKWFKTENFAAPPAYTFGNAGRIISDVRSHGLNNWDLAVLKKTKITERADLQFRAEAFNLFNRVQFGWPGLIAGLANFGQVGSQGNSPRVIQFGLRLSF